MLFKICMAQGTFKTSMVWQTQVKTNTIYSHIEDKCKKLSHLDIIISCVHFEKVTKYLTFLFVKKDIPSKSLLKFNTM